MDRRVSRRTLLVQVAAAAGAGAIATRSSFAQAKIPIAVYKDKTCGCCHLWVQHMEANGFTVAVTDATNMTAIKTKYKVPSALQSCHTAIAGTYVIEGHVPAADVKRLLTQKPAGILGLTVPGMPASAPGMDVKPFQAFTVLTFDAKGATTVYAKHDKG